MSKASSSNYVSFLRKPFTGRPEISKPIIPPTSGSSQILKLTRKKWTTKKWTNGGETRREPALNVINAFAGQLLTLPSCQHAGHIQKFVCVCVSALLVHGHKNEN
jgi:hypothetical protein